MIDPTPITAFCMTSVGEKEPSMTHGPTVSIEIDPRHLVG